MHALFYTYHWREEDVMNMPRRRRKLWFQIVLEQRKAEVPDRKSTQGYQSKSSTYREASY